MDDNVSKVKPFLLNSIARFLKSNGFSRTLKKLRSEAHFEDDDAKNSTLDLEEMFLKFMDSTNDSVTSAATKQDAENKPKYKKRKASTSTEIEVEEFKKEAEINTVDRKSTSNLREGPVEHDKNKSKHKKKKASRYTEFEVKESKKEGEKILTKENPFPLNVEKKSKDKKKKPSCSTDKEVQKCMEEEKNSTDNGKPFLDDRGDFVKDEDKNFDKVVVGKENKVTKKRKRHGSKECEIRSINGDTVEESRPNDTDVLRSINGDTVEESRPNDTDVTEDLETISNKDHNVEIQEVFGHCNGANKSAEKAGEKSFSQKSMKKQNGSAEPTSAKTFQRVKVEEVVFSDERLKDNSYWAKDGAETGYGAKAQEVLGQVRGRDFRHEKTKKKRGSYRGGQIDLLSHSVKFNYSDDE